MEVEIEKVDIFKQLINFIGGIGNETLFKFSEEGLEVMIADSTQSPNVMAKIKIDSNFFSNYNVAEEESIGLFLKDFKDGLRTTAKITLKTEEDTFKIITDKSTYTAPIITNVGTLDRIPDITYDNEPITIDMFDIKNALSATNSITEDKINFKTKDGMLMVTCEENVRNVSTDLITSNAELNVGFGKLLLKPVQSIPNTEVCLKLQNDLPIIIEQTTDDYKLTFILAGRI